MPPADEDVVAATSGATVAVAAPPAKADEAAKDKTAARAIFFIVSSIKSAVPDVQRGGRRIQTVPLIAFQAGHTQHCNGFRVFSPLFPAELSKKQHFWAFQVRVTILTHQSRCFWKPWLNQQNLRSSRGILEQLYDVFVVKPDATIRRAAANLAGVVRAVDAVGGPAQIQSPNPQRIFR